MTQILCGLLSATGIPRFGLLCKKGSEMADGKSSALARQEIEDILKVSCSFREGFSPILADVLRARAKQKKPIMNTFLGLVDFAAQEVASAITIISSVEDAGIGTEELVAASVRVFEAALKNRLGVKDRKETVN